MASTSASMPSSSNSVHSKKTTVKPRKNAAGARHDPGWEHGDDLGDRKVRCKYCRLEFTGGIYRFKNHLARTRKDVAPCLQVPEDVIIKMLGVLEESEGSTKKRRGMLLIDDEEETIENSFTRNSQRSFPKKGKGQSTLNGIYKKDEREKVCQQIARFFYTSALSFNCVNNPEFAKMIEMVGAFGRGLNPPSYHEMRVTLLKKEVDYTRSLLEEYKKEWKKTGCTLMSDGWSDRKNRSICNFLVNTPKGTIFLAPIDTSEISKTKEKVFEMLDDFVEKVGEEHVVQVVTDNAANYKAAGEMLMQKRRKLFWTPCAAHCIDLMLEDFEKKILEHKETIAKGRKITSFIYNRTRLICLLKEYTKGKELLRPGATRFATAYLTLSRLYEQKSALISMFASEKWVSSNFAKSEAGKNIETIVLDNLGFWGSVASCLKAAVPLIKVLRMVDSDSQPAMGFIYNAMALAKKEIKNNFKDVQMRYQPVFDIIDERWQHQLHKPLHVAGYYLNPRMQYSADFLGDSGFIKAGLYTCLERMCGDPVLATEIDCQFDKFKNARGLFGYDVAKRSRDAKSPVDWWDSYGDDTPELKKFAMRVLSLTCSSSGCERNWSAFEMVHSKRRNRLHQQKMNDLVYVIYNLKLSTRKEKKLKETAAEMEQLETLNFDDVGSDDEWITEEESAPLQTNEDWINILDDSNHLQPHGSGDDVFLERAIRDQFGSGGDSREANDLDLDEENGSDAPFEILD